MYPTARHSEATPTSRRTLARAFFPVLVLAVLAAGCGEGPAGSGSPQVTALPSTTPTIESGPPAATLEPTPDMKSTLSPDVQRLLAEARARGETEKLLFIAAEPGRSNAVAAAVERLGGTIRSRHPDLDFISAVVPLEQVETVAQLEGVQAISLDEELPVPDPRP